MITRMGGFKIPRVDACSREATYRNSREISAEVPWKLMRRTWRGVASIFSKKKKKTWVKSWQRERGKGNLNVTKVHETRKEFVKVHLLILSVDFHDGALYFVKQENFFFFFLKMDVIPYLELVDYIFIK